MSYNNYKVIVLKDTVFKINKIYDYLLESTFSLEVALKISNWIYSKINSLSFMPKMHRIIFKEF